MSVSKASNAPATTAARQRRRDQSGFIAGKQAGGPARARRDGALTAWPDARGHGAEGNIGKRALPGGTPAGQLDGA